MKVPCGPRNATRLTAPARAPRRAQALPEITGNGLDGVHQVAFSPTTGELFAANQGNGISRFVFDNAGTPAANGTIGSGTTRGVFVAKTLPHHTRTPAGRRPDRKSSIQCAG